MNLKRYLIFVLDKDPDGIMAKLRFRVKWQGGVVNFATGYRVEIEKWEASTQRCRMSTTHGKLKIQANIINREIQRYETAAKTLLDNYESKDKNPSKEELRYAFNVAVKRKQRASKVKHYDSSFFSVFDQFTETMGAENSWEDATFTKFNSIRTHLKDFDPDISFNTLSDAKMNEFVKYLGKVHMRNTTIAKMLAFVRWFLRWAHKMEYYFGNVHETFRPKLKGTDGNAKEVIYLTWEELMYLKDMPIPEDKKWLEATRDVFCFCCFTSLRYSDLQKLRRSDVRDKEIRIVTKKTVDGLVIDLNKYSRAILDKYADKYYPDDKALPVISNPAMNEALKKIGQLAGFNEQHRVVYFKGRDRFEDVMAKHELLTTHCGRRTFIVNALFLGIPAEVVMSWTGHADYKAMKPYIKIVSELKSKEMDKFNI